MIDLMKNAVQPKEFQNQFELLPKGTYEARVMSIADWKAKEHQTLKVFQFDDSGRKVTDNGKDVTTIENNVTTYSAQVIFEVTTEGMYKGARVYYYLNLHPNQPWALPSFLNACGIVDSILPRQVQTMCLDSLVNLSVDIEKKAVPTTDKVTGATVDVEREQNVVKKIKAIDLKV